MVWRAHVWRPDALRFPAVPRMSRARAARSRRPVPPRLRSAATLIVHASRLVCDACSATLHLYVTRYVSCYTRILCNTIWQRVMQGLYARSFYVPR
eukprot:2231462-Pleurochrysis_carterae.AAC.1